MANIYRALERARRENRRIPVSVPSPRKEVTAPVDAGRFEAQMRLLTQKLDAALAEKHPLIIMICASNPAEGATSVARELGAHFARENRNVLLCGNRGELGFTEASNYDDGTDCFATETPNLYVSELRVPKETGYAGGNAPDLATWIASLDREFDIVVIDSPPPSSKEGPLARLSSVDGILLVVEAERTRRKNLAMVVKMIEDAGGHIMGIVFNKRRSRIPAFVYRFL
jgi:Mrp family chromosome partitioning ATPase